MITDSSFFTKRDSSIIAGLAILLMIWVHLFCLPSAWYASGVSWNSVGGYPVEKITEIIGRFGTVCVPMFALISGYALWTCATAYATLRLRMQRLLKFLGAYWIICLLFLFIGFLTNAKMPSLWQFVHNLFGFDTKLGEIINVPFAWYVRYYIIFVLISPCLLFVFKSKNRWCDIGAFIGITQMINLFGYIDNPHITPITTALFPLVASALGILIAKYKLFEYFSLHFTSRRAPISLILMIGVLVVIKYIIARLILEQNWINITLSAIIAAILILFFIEFIHKIKVKLLETILVFLGGISMNLWFLHGIFFVGKCPLQKAIYMLNEPILIFFAVLLILIPIAWALTRSYKKMVNLL